ncbi:MAG TPA: hypothetical protein VHH36_08925 [Candidatus Thermoplasmatota archaeon]|nr:hypothetical protein [Candidatus Thermoplasmatota archaeon]
MPRPIAACACAALLALLVPAPVHADPDVGVCSQTREWGGYEDSTGSRDCVVLVQTDYVCVGYHQDYRSAPTQDHANTTCQHRLV